MSTPPPFDAEASSDAELIALVRGGDLEAYGQLFSRHRDAALRLARQLTWAGDADDLVSDAFNGVLRVLTNGGGPDVAFRPYLLTAVRRRHIDSMRSGKRVRTTDDIEQFDRGQPFRDPAVAAFESTTAARAFTSLPERWQMVLWQMEVEGQKPAEIAVLLGISANSVSALAYRAREGLRQAYLQNHLADTGDAECRWVTERLGAYVRNGLARREGSKVSEHLDGCDRCSAVYLELVEVNSNLRAVIAPAILGSAAAAYLAATHGAAAGGTALASSGSWLGHAWHVVTANGAIAGGTAAATAAVVGIVAATALTGGPGNNRVADPLLSSGLFGSVGPAATSSSSSTSAAPRRTKQTHARHAVPASRSVTARSDTPATVLPRSALPGSTVPTSVVTTGLTTSPTTLPTTTPTTSVPTSAVTTTTVTTSTTTTTTSITTATTPTTSTTTTTTTATATTTAPTTSSTPTTTTTTTVPPVDVSLTDNPYVGGSRYLRFVRSPLFVATQEPATQLTMVISTSSRLLLVLPHGWRCDATPVARDRTCTIVGATPPPLWIMVVEPGSGPLTYTATVTAANDVGDPPGNNTVSFSG